MEKKPISSKKIQSEKVNIAPLFEEAKQEQIKINKQKREQEKKEETAEPTPITSEAKQNKYIIAAIITIIIIIGAIILLPKFYTPKAAIPITISDKLKEAYTHPSETAFVYNGFPFVKQDGSWYTNIQSSINNQVYTIPLHFSPKEVENITITGNLDQFLGRLENNLSNFQYQTYLTFDPIGNDLAYVAVSTGELSINLGKVLNIAVVAVCSNDKDPACTRNQTKPITCENTKDPVIFYKEETPAQITIKNNCLTIQGREYDLVKGTDRLLYKMYGIIN